jgi:hypothetical protein
LDHLAVGHAVVSAPQLSDRLPAVPFTLGLGEDEATEDEQEGWRDARNAEFEARWDGYPAMTLTTGQMNLDECCRRRH